MKRFVVVSNVDIRAFEKAVTEALNKGWELHGTVFVTVREVEKTFDMTTVRSQRPFMHQAFILVEKKPA